MPERKPDPVLPFTQPLKRLTVASLDLDYGDLVVEAQYNPKELELAKQVGWTEHDVLTHPTTAKAKAAAAAQRGFLHLEFTGRKSRILSLELLFDGFEEGRSIEPLVQALETLSSPIDATSHEESLRRPHLVLVVWGGDRGAMPPFKCVIESLKTKYTAFSRDGHPLRAVCNVTFKEAHLLSLSKGEREQFSGERVKPPR